MHKSRNGIVTLPLNDISSIFAILSNQMIFAPNNFPNMHKKLPHPEPPEMTAFGLSLIMIKKQ